jgi:zinc transporter, ZIP family
VRRLVVGVVAGVAIGAGAVAILARGDTVHAPVASAEEPGLAVERSTLRAGQIVLLARNGGTEPVRIAQVMVNDAFVDFHAARVIVPPSRRTEIAVHYPWVAGESYEIGLLTATGAIVEYELEDAGET